MARRRKDQPEAQEPVIEEAEDEQDIRLPPHIDVTVMPVAELDSLAIRFFGRAPQDSLPHEERVATVQRWLSAGGPY